MTTARAAWTKRFWSATDVPPPGRQKYGARVKFVDGIRFDSTKEARRYRELVMLARAGAISRLEVHPMFSITVVALARVTSGAIVNASNLQTVGVYTADFRYVDASGAVVVEDVKSRATKKLDAYRLRKRLVEAIYGIVISEI